MIKYLLNTAQAMELFAHIAVADDSSLSLENFSVRSVVQEINKQKYIKRHYCYNLSDRVFGRTKDLKDNLVIVNQNWFYDFFRRVRQGEPIVIESGILSDIEVWINGHYPSPQYKLYHPEEIKNLNVPAIQEKLENTYWAMWTYEYWPKNIDNKIVREHYIVRQVLHFQKFGKVEMYARNIQKGWDQDYVGAYFVGGADDNYLYVQMKMRETGKKNLNMIFYIGKDRVDLAVGEYNNVGLAMYCGPLLIEKMESNYFNREDALKYYHEDDPDIPPYIKTFYKYPHECMVEMPSRITDVTTLTEFLIRKDSER